MSSSSGGVSFLELLIVLKLTGHIDWPWWLAPAWVTGAIAGIGLAAITVYERHKGDRPWKRRDR